MREPIGFLRSVAELFLGVFLPATLAFWALVGNKGLRTCRRVFREDYTSLDQHSDDEILQTPICDECRLHEGHGVHQGESFPELKAHHFRGHK